MKKKDKQKYKNTFMRIFIFLTIILFCIFLYSKYIGTKGLIIKEYAVINNKIPASFHGFKIVHFSDLHYGSTVKQNELKNIVKNINQLNPDIIVFTGDLLNPDYKMEANETQSIIDTLNQLNPLIKMYLIKGDHDNSNDYTNIVTKLNFIELNNQNTLLYYNETSPVRLVGLDSDYNLEKAFNYMDEESKYTIVLAHQPDTFNFIKDYQIDLMLCGHSHNGQVRLPFIGAIYKPEGAKIYYDPYYKIDDTLLYISGGIGTSKIPLRLFNKPSINFYRLYTS